jgi:diguanylate cyclase (GGDEF)-like protein
MRARRPAGGALAVLFLDLDGFKGVNDTHGHAAGDTVLVQVAERLRGALRAATCWPATAGDEFVAVLAACTRPTPSGSPTAWPRPSIAPSGARSPGSRRARG